MTTEPIVESGMAFGPYSDDSVFHIEKSMVYTTMGSGVRMAEFLLLRQSKGEAGLVWVVEAKSSSPRPETQPNFEGFIEEVRQKLSNALMLCLAACLRRHKDAQGELPAGFRTLNLSAARFRMVLVIKGHQDSWLPPLQDALSMALRAFVKVWALSPTAVAVINDQRARKHGLIL
jgi:hypothetical protein